MEELTPEQSKEVVNLLLEMIIQADEDTPSEFRTDHFRTAMDNGIEFLKSINKW